MCEAKACLLKYLVLLVLHDLSVGGLFGQQFPSSALQDGLHGAEAGADSRGQVEILPLQHHKHRDTLNAYLHICVICVITHIVYYCVQ